MGALSCFAKTLAKFLRRVTKIRRPADGAGNVRENIFRAPSCVRVSAREFLHIVVRPLISLRMIDEPTSSSASVLVRATMPVELIRGPF